jgi:Domain of unknown function (DUF2019)
MSFKLKDKTQAELVELFVDASISHGQGTLNGDYKKCNKAYSVIQKVYDELKRRDLIENALLDLLTHDDTSVRLWAASYLLPIVPTESIMALSGISSNRDGNFRLDAELVLEEWEKGELKF